MGDAGFRRGKLADNAVIDYWRFRDKFAQVLDPRYYPLEWLDLQIATGKMTLFIDGESAILTSVRTYPSGLKELHGECAVGKLKVITASIIPRAIEWARSNGCESAVIESRAEWVRIMKNDGFEVHQVSIRKVL